MNTVTAQRYVADFWIVGNDTKDITYFANVYDDDFPVHISDVFKSGGVWYASVEAYFGKPFVSYPSRNAPAVRTSYATLPFSQITYSKTDPLEIAAYQAALWAAEATPQMNEFLNAIGTALNEFETLDPIYDHYLNEPPLPLAEQVGNELANNAHWLSDSSPTEEGTAPPISKDGVSSPEWFDGIEPIEF